MDVIQILVLAAVQGAAELLPVSSSAHVIVAEKLMGLDPTTPAMTLLLVLLHTGTMLAVILHFGPAWRARWFAGGAAGRAEALQLTVATAATGAVGFGLMKALAWALAAPGRPFEVEQLFGHAPLMATALAAAGVLILWSGWRDVQRLGPLGEARTVGSAAAAGVDPTRPMAVRQALAIGAVQGLCLPFRGFSRSGATISTALALGVARRRAEDFSFALAVVLTPPVIAREAWRLVQAGRAGHPGTPLDGAALASALRPGAIGLVTSFIAGWLALRLLSRWMERGRWHWFGVYCLTAAVVVLWVG